MDVVVKLLLTSVVLTLMLGFIMWVCGGCTAKKEEESEPTPDPMPDPKEVAKMVALSTFGALFAAGVVAAAGTAFYVGAKEAGFIPEKEIEDEKGE